MALVALVARGGIPVAVVVRGALVPPGG